MKTIQRSAILSFIALLLLFSAIPAFADEVAVLTYVKGRVDIFKPGWERAVPVETGAALSVGDIVRTKSDSKAEITFIDSSVIRLGQSTRLEITTYLFDEKGKRKESVLNLFRGKIRATVPKDFRLLPAAFSQGPKFEIHTPNAVTGIRGTDFFTRYIMGTTSVLFIEGNGYTYNPGVPDRLIIVSAGEATVVISDQPPAPARVAGEGEINILINDTSPETQVEAEDDSAPETEGVASTEGDTFTYTLPEDDGTAGEETFVVVEETAPIITVDPPDTTTTAETIIIIYEDTEPPVIAFTATPESETNLNAASFMIVTSDNVTSSENITLSYTLDGEAVATPDLTGLSEGTHSFSATATDEMGSSATESYTWTTDYTAPVTSNTPTASPEPGSGYTALSFSLSSDEPVTYSYSLEGVEGTSTTGDISFTVLAEGSYTFDYTATDEVGNTTSDSLSLDLSLYTLTGSASGSGSDFTGSVTGDISAISGGDWGGWLMDMGGAYTGPAGLSWTMGAGGDGHDGLGAWDGFWLYSASGAYGDGSTLSGTSDLTYLTTTTLGTGAGVISGTYDAEDGTWQATDSSNGAYTETPLAFVSDIHADIFHGTRYYSDTYYYEDGSYYWREYDGDNTWGSGYYSVSGDYIAYNSDGTTSTCDSYGVCVDGTWDPASEDLALLLLAPPGGYTSTDSYDFPIMNNTGYMDGLIGGTGSLWSGIGTPVTIVGEYSDYYGTSTWVDDDIYSYNYIDETFTTYDGGAYYGFMGGTKYGDNLDVKFLALYIDPYGNAGYLRTDLTGAFYPDSGMWETSGSLTTVEMGPAAVSPSDLYGAIVVGTTGSEGASLDGTLAAGGSMTGTMSDGLTYSISGQDWGLYRVMANGAYTGGGTSGPLNLSTEYINDPFVAGFESAGTWSTDDNKFRAAGLGYGAEEGGSAWISVGDTFGTFNPDTLTWESLMMGMYLEADRLLLMACPDSPCTANPQALQDLNIPAIEVGRATLSGSGNGFTDLSMADTIFFAYSSGAAPKIWATGDVSGVYTAPPVIDTAVSLSGGGLIADFTFKNWDAGSGAWLSTIDGSGGFNGSTTFEGAGAGTGATSGAGTISGTATGLAQ